MSYLDKRARHYGQQGEPTIAAVPALDGRDGLDIVVRIDGTYFGATEAEVAGWIAAHRAQLDLERDAADLERGVGA